MMTSGLSSLVTFALTLAVSIFVKFSSGAALPESALASSNARELQCTELQDYYNHERYRPTDCMIPFNFFREQVRKTGRRRYEFLSYGRHGDSGLPKMPTPIRLPYGETSSVVAVKEFEDWTEVMQFRRLR